MLSIITSFLLVVNHRTILTSAFVTPYHVSHKLSNTPSHVSSTLPTSLYPFLITTKLDPFHSPRSFVKGRLTVAGAKMVQHDSNPSSLSLFNTIKTSLIGPFAIAIKGFSDMSENDIFECWTLYPMDDSSSLSNSNDVTDEKGVGAIDIKHLEMASLDGHEENAAHVFESHVQYNDQTNTIDIQIRRKNGNVKEDDVIHKEEEDMKSLDTIFKVMMERAIMDQYQQIMKSKQMKRKTNDDNDDDLTIQVEIQAVPASASFQASLSRKIKTNIHDSEEEKETMMHEFQKRICSLLFETDTSTSDIELVDMVDSNGDPLAIVPRNVVHSCNILHRGAGIVICKDHHIHPHLLVTSSQPSSLPMIYVHRRTDNKRIFPSLYDMFIGGVSLTGESALLTAAREVAEELGLNRGLLQQEGNIEEEGGIHNDETEAILNGPLFKCTVCTGYNRCVVTVYTYKVEVETENFQWQEEEVAWGDFVPYSITKEAGNLSIERLKKNGTWPGTYSKRNENELGYSNTNNNEWDLDDLNDDWKTWDFVPDGLLVWEAWEEWLERETLV